MARSMTGFSHHDFVTTDIQGSIDLKSYNNRYLDLSVSLPSWLTKFEPRVRELLSAAISHGKAEFWLRARSLGIPVRAAADISAAASVATALREIARAAGISEEISLANLLAVEGMLSFEREVDEESLWALLEPEIVKTIFDFNNSREIEGSAMVADIKAGLTRIEAGLGQISRYVPEIEENLRRVVRERFLEVMGVATDDTRILAEVASLLLKYTINEEVVRLAAHVASFHATLAGTQSPGKKLDFLCQEMNREVNTIGSKSMLLPVSETVIELKDALENIREQLRNIE